ncbi:MAG: adenine phosphoribosyltransferase, partial [Flammeovirgaceae bacterium]
MNLREELLSIIRDVPDFPKPGILFRDITPILENPKVSRAVVSEMMHQLEGMKIDAVAGIESRGFLFGLPLAMEMNVPFIAIRKKGKLPAETVEYSYDLEYGSATIEMHRGVVEPGMNVLIHDDLLATGGTAVASRELIHLEGG